MRDPRFYIEVAKRLRESAKEVIGEAAFLQH